MMGQVVSHYRILESRTRDFHVPRSFLVCVLSLWLTLSAAQALDPNKRLSQYAHTAWRIQDGFLPNTPFWISQTKDGYLWVGGPSGAFRFDGVRFTPWSTPIASPPILHPVSVRAGEFWIATQDGIAHVRDNVVISQYDLLGISGMYKDSDGSVWTLSFRNPDRVLCQVTDTKIHCFGKTEGITINVASSFIPDGKGGFWIGGDTSLLHWKMGAAPEIYNLQHLQSNVGQRGISSLVEDSDGSLLVGMAAGPGLGLERLRNGVLTPLVLPNFEGTKLSIEAMIEDSDKNLWIATYGNGIYRIHGQTVDHFGRADGLSSDTVVDLYESDDGIVWVATSNGIDNFRDLPVTTFSTSEGLGRDGASSVTATKDGTVWVANVGTLDFIRNGTVSSVRVPGQQVSSLLEDHQGNMWVGVDDGLFIYKDGRFRRIPEPDHHPLGLVVGITEDVEGNIWVECKGAERRLIHIRDFKVREEYSEPQIPAAKAIAADPKGGIWLGTLTGDLTFFREGIGRTFPLNLKSKHWAYQIAVDPDGSVITASPDGLVMLRSGKVQRLGKENGLPCDGVTGFAVDDNRNLWLNTPCGFIEIAASDVQRWRIHPETITQTRLFGTLDGARPGRVSFNPAVKSPDGRLWFVNSVVLQMIDPSHLSGDGTVSPVYVESVVADRKQYKPQEGLQLSPLTRDLQIGYTSPSFLIPQKVKFRYRLDGHDLDWQDADTRRQAFYTDLGPGKYRFRVIACNNDGVWNEAGAAVEFSILPTFYQTTWFLALCIASTLTVLYLLYLLRLRQVAQHVRGRMETRLAERERIARDLHDTLLQGVQGLILKVHAGLRQIPTEVPGRQTIEKALDYGDQVVAEGRDRVRNLRSTAGLSDLSLAFQRVADEMRQDSSASVKTVVEGTKRELHPVVLEESYSIGREALVNALSHSEGQHVEVGIIYDPKQFRLRVRDDGRGIEPKILEKGSREGHWGLQGMRERAEKIGGQLEFWSRPGTGTEVELTVPAKTAYRSSAAKNKSA
jgi:ligand-binding sensor domain-containing protein/two-component sensor histidine kinase